MSDARRAQHARLFHALSTAVAVLAIHALASSSTGVCELTRAG